MECQAQLYTSNFNSQFCIEMANQVLLKEVEKGSNFGLSPLSFHVMLSLIAVGATGETLKQLLSHLGSRSINDLTLLSSQIVALASMSNEGNNLTASPLLSFANGVWVDQRFNLKPSFEKIVKDAYKAKTKEVDFARKPDQARDEVINSWVENATKGLIKEVLPPGSVANDTALVFANALYFKGEWDQKFEKSQTEHHDFHLLNGEVVEVPFMTSEIYTQHLYGSFDGFKVLSIPYHSGEDTRKFSMYFFLPDEVDGFPKLIQKFNSSFLNQNFELRKMRFPDFWIPRFKFSFEFEASEIIKEMGLEVPFMKVGELTRMIDAPQNDKLSISRVFHKSYIEVNEEGTEAAASTVQVSMFMGARFPIPSFVADHPFMFVIREETSGIVFFAGAVLNPLQVD